MISVLFLESEQRLVATSRCQDLRQLVTERDDRSGLSLAEAVKRHVQEVADPRTKRPARHMHAAGAEPARLSVFLVPREEIAD